MHDYTNDWGARFSKYVPALQAKNDSQLLEAAAVFKEVFPECPFAPWFLVQRFIKQGSDQWNGRS